MGSGPIVGILLAAGSATRFGGDKLLALLSDGTPMAIAAARSLAGSVDSLVAVVRPGDLRLAAALARDDLRVTACPLASDGMGASLAWGVRTAPIAAAWVIALADMPWIRPATVAQIVDATRGSGTIVAPSYKGARGHPVGFASSFHPELVALGGDEGAKAILARHAATLIETDDPGILRDVDTPSDLAQ